MDVFCIYQPPKAANIYLYPNGDYSKSMVSVGDTTHYKCVDDARDAPDYDATYVYTTSTSNVSDIFTLQDNSLASGTINYVQAYAIAKSDLYTQSPSGIYKIFLDLAGVHSLSSDFDLTTDYGLYNYIFYTAPGGSIWTWTNINALRLGILANSPLITTTTNAIFRPNGAGALTQLIKHGATNNWDCTDDTISDDDATYVQQESGAIDRHDLYALPDHTTESGNINSVTIFNRSKKELNAPAYINEYMRLYSTNFTGSTAHNLSQEYTLYSTTWNSSPSDASSWKWVNIDNIQSGVLANQDASGTHIRVTQNYLLVNYNINVSPQIRTTQAYIKVNYTSTASCYFLRQPETYKLSHERNITKFNTWSEHIVRDDGRNSKNLTLQGCEYLSGATYRLNAVRNAVELGLDCTFFNLFDGNLNTTWHIKSFDYDRNADNPNLWNWTINCEKA